MKNSQILRAAIKIFENSGRNMDNPANRELVIELEDVAEDFEDGARGLVDEEYRE